MASRFRKGPVFEHPISFLGGQLHQLAKQSRDQSADFHGTVASRHIRVGVLAQRLQCVRELTRLDLLGRDVCQLLLAQMDAVAISVAVVVGQVQFEVRLKVPVSRFCVVEVEPCASDGQEQSARRFDVGAAAGACANEILDGVLDQYQGGFGRLAILQSR